MKGLMKKLLAMGLLLALALTLGGCGVPAETNMAFSDEPPQLVERKYPETLEEFLREERWDYRWDYYTDREEIGRDEAMRLLGAKIGYSRGMGFSGRRTHLLVDGCHYGWTAGPVTRRIDLYKPRRNGQAGDIRRIRGVPTGYDYRRVYRSVLFQG